MSTICFIYVLSDPLTDQAFYVGQTEDPDTRVKTHLSENPSSSSCETVTKIHDRGHEVRAWIVDACYCYESEQVEAYWAGALRAMGHPVGGRHHRIRTSFDHKPILFDLRLDCTIFIAPGMRHEGWNSMPLDRARELILPYWTRRGQIHPHFFFAFGGAS